MQCGEALCLTGQRGGHHPWQLERFPGKRRPSASFILGQSLVYKGSIYPAWVLWPLAFPNAASEWKAMFSSSHGMDKLIRKYQVMNLRIREALLAKRCLHC